MCPIQFLWLSVSACPIFVAVTEREIRVCTHGQIVLINANFWPRVQYQRLYCAIITSSPVPFRSGFILSQLHSSLSHLMGLLYLKNKYTATKRHNSENRCMACSSTSSSRVHGHLLLHVRTLYPLFVYCLSFLESKEDTSVYAQTYLPSTSTSTATQLLLMCVCIKCSQMAS